MIVKKMPILQGFPDFETVKFFTGKFFQKYNFTPVFYDIETTGLSTNSTYLYLIGAVGIEDETWNFYQWMVENANEEETILRIFSQFLQDFDYTVSYNGNNFDQPYLENKYEKYQIPSPFEGKKSLDLYVTLKPLKKLLKLPAMKQPCMEEFLGIKDRIYDNGKEFIKLYKYFLKKRIQEETEEVVIKLLNEDLYHLDKIQTQTATARLFLIAVRIKPDDQLEVHSLIHRIEKLIRMQNISVTRADKELIKRMLAVYFEQNVTTSQFEDYDGKRWYDGIQ